MSKNSDNGVAIKLTGVRMSFPHLFARDSFNRYSAAFLVEPGSDNDKKIRDAINRAAKNKWKDNAAAKLKALIANDPKNVCYRSGDTKTNADGEVLDGYDGVQVLSATTRAQPTLLDEKRNAVGADDDKLYSGCYVVAIVEIWAQDGVVRDKQTGKSIKAQGIRCQLQGVQHYRDGASFGGGRKASRDEFDDVPVNVDDDENIAGDEFEDDLAF